MLAIETVCDESIYDYPTSGPTDTYQPQSLKEDLLCWSNSARQQIKHHILQTRLPFPYVF